MIDIFLKKIYLKLILTMFIAFLIASCSQVTKEISPGTIHFTVSTNFAVGYFNDRTQAQSVQKIIYSTYIPQGLIEQRRIEHWRGQFKEMIWENEEKWDYSWKKNRVSLETYWNRDKKLTQKIYYSYKNNKVSTKIFLDPLTNQIRTYSYSNQLLMLEMRETIADSNKQILYFDYNEKGLLKKKELRLSDTVSLFSTHYQYDEQGHIKKSISLNGEGEVLWGNEYECNKFGYVVYEEEFSLDEFRKKQDPSVTYTHYTYY